MKKILVMASMMLLGSSGAWALGTLAGTTIDNNATLTFSAGGVVQPEVNATLGASGSADSFVVDKKIDMILEINDADHVTGALGQANVVTSFAFKNEGNSNERFHFHARNLIGGDSDNTDHPGDDTQNVSNLVISCDYTDESGTAQTLTGAVDADIVIFTQVDSVATCTVSATLPTGVADGSIMNIELNATAYSDATTAEVETSGADTQSGTPDVVFADGVAIHNGSAAGGLGDTAGEDNASTGDNGDGIGAGDGSDVARNGYIIQTPDLSVDKTSCVLSDPVNGDGSDANANPPKRIPGAIIRYMFDIDNHGTGDVTDVNLTDALSSNLIVTRTINSARKSENQGTTACSCGTEPGIDIHTDTSLSGNDMTIQHINIAAGHGVGTPVAHNHTCVSVEVEID